MKCNQSSIQYNNCTKWKNHYPDFITLGLAGQIVVPCEYLKIYHILNIYLWIQDSNIYSSIKRLTPTNFIWNVLTYETSLL